MQFVASIRHRRGADYLGVGPGLGIDVNHGDRVGRLAVRIEGPGGSIWYSKGKLPKIFNTPYGVVSVERHVYQPAEGGKTFCPMDDGARIIRKATPRFAKIVSHEFARGAAAEVVEDLEQNHGRSCLKASLQDLATHVGTVVQTKEESWSLPSRRTASPA
jgi:hypothetical protein